MSFVNFFDLTILELEKSLSAEAKKISNKLVNEVFKNTENIENANLDIIKMEMGLSNNHDIYIIDRNGIVVNTTFTKDLGLNFFKIGDFLKNHLNSVWDGEKFVEDRISMELSTNLPKKYTYQPTLDGKYIIELGLYHKSSEKLVKDFLSYIENIPKDFEGIDSVNLYYGNDALPSFYQKCPLNKYDYNFAQKTLKNRKKSSYKRDGEDGQTCTVDIDYLEMEEAIINEGLLVRIVQNNKQELTLVDSEIKKLGFNLLVYLLPIVLLLLWQAKNISNSLKRMVSKTEIIKSGNLNERVALQGPKESALLAQHFNSMVDELQESYNTLEQKVEDRTKELRYQKEIVDEKNQEILDSINYAKRIQKAILPPDKVIKENLPNSFVLYLPKDIVAGDFYWMETVGNKTIFAAADCTGHGVPGAMVSVICNNALNRAVREFKLTEPCKILDKVREIVISEFEKSEEEVKDGMDISLCVLDGTSLHYAGANNPLWIVRNNELIEYKANKQPIGKYAKETPFLSHKLELLKDDCIYLSTDGYPDQFGGPKGKKMKAANFKKLLVSISNQSVSEQKAKINSHFINWLGDFEQLDDVCVIGVKI